MAENKFRPFSNGTQYMDWTNANCNRCKKSALLNSEGGYNCVIEKALLEAYLTDGEVGEQIANRMGYLLNQGKDNWMCPEVEWTEEWKSECIARQCQSQNLN